MNPYYPGYLPPYYMESSNNATSSIFDDLTCNQNHTIRWKSGEGVDPRLLGLLESFGEIYVDRREFFHRIFHGDHDELFKKIGDVLKKKKQMKKTGSLKRSTSMRVIRQRGIEDEGGLDEIRLERFKIRTPNVIVATEDDGHVDQVTKGSNGTK